MSERIDLGPCRAIRHDGDAKRCAVLLPGQFYPTRAPALWFAREAAMHQGWSAIEVLGEIAERELPAVWLTPLLGEASVIDGLAATRRPALLASGDADSTWRLDALPHNPALEVLDLPGVDHAVQVPGDLRASLDALIRLVDGIARFLDSLD